MVNNSDDLLHIEDGDVWPVYIVVLMLIATALVVYGHPYAAIILGGLGILLPAGSLCWETRRIARGLARVIIHLTIFVVSFSMIWDSILFMYRFLNLPWAKLWG